MKEFLLKRLNRFPSYLFLEISATKFLAFEAIIGLTVWNRLTDMLFLIISSGEPRSAKPPRVQPHEEFSTQTFLSSIL